MEKLKHAFEETNEHYRMVVCNDLSTDQKYKILEFWFERFKVGNGKLKL